MADLLKSLIRLAHANLDHREKILSVIRTASEKSHEDIIEEIRAEFDAGSIGKDHDPQSEDNPKRDYLKDHFTQKRFHQMKDMRDKGLLADGDVWADSMLPQPPESPGLRLDPAGLRAASVFLAYQNPELRPYLLPLLRKNNE